MKTAQKSGLWKAVEPARTCSIASESRGDCVEGQEVPASFPNPAVAPTIPHTMIVLIDNYDSFTYNLVQKLGEVSPGLEIRVFRNDKISVDQVEEMKPTHIVISPGPCTPKEG